MKKNKSSKWLVATGVIVCLLTIVFALWMGLYVCMYGGVVSVITGFSTTPWMAGTIAWGVVKFLCTGFVGWFSLFCGWGFGMFLIAMGE